MRTLICALALVAASTAPAVAGDKTTVEGAGKGRTLYICDASTMTKRAFTREFGKTEFVTAEQVKRGEAWDAPKCITPAEARKLKQVASR